MKLSAVVVDYAALSNSDLDSAYAAAFATGDSPIYTAAGDEIIQRLATPLSAFESALGIHRFPQWDAIQASGRTTASFVATDTAQQAVVDASGNVVKKVESVLTNGAWLVGGAVLLYALVATRLFKRNRQH